MSRSTKIVVVTLVVGSLAGLGVTFAARIESAVEARREAEKPVEVEPRYRDFVWSPTPALRCGSAVGDIRSWWTWPG